MVEHIYQLFVAELRKYLEDFYDELKGAKTKLKYEVEGCIVNELQQPYACIYTWKESDEKDEVLYQGT